MNKNRICKASTAWDLKPGDGRLNHEQVPDFGKVWRGWGFAALVVAVFIFSFAYFASAAPSQTTTSWKDNFSDSTGISTISNLNFSIGNISISNSPWFYPDHEYRKPITISRNIDPWWNSS